MSGNALQTLSKSSENIVNHTIIIQHLKFNKKQNRTLDQPLHARRCFANTKDGFQYVIPDTRSYLWKQFFSFNTWNLS